MFSFNLTWFIIKNWNLKRLQNPKFNIAECTQGLDDLQTYLALQRSENNFKLFGESATLFAWDLGMGPEFLISKLRKKVCLFVYEDRDEPGSNHVQQFKTAFYFAIFDDAISGR